MSECCPLSSGFTPGFYYGEDIPEFCLERCEELWERAVTETIPDHEEYPSYLFPDSVDCSHFATESGNSSLQASALNSSERFFTTTERCMGCSEEIAEDSYPFRCPHP